MMRALLCASLATLARGHGAMTFPKPRQALDGALAPWSDWAYPCDERHENGSCIITFCEDGTECQGSCPVSAHVAGHPDALNASNGQACYWFSNGCTIGCDACDGTTNHVGHVPEHAARGDGRRLRPRRGAWVRAFLSCGVLGRLHH